MDYIMYTSEQLNELKNKDKTMCELIEKIGVLERELSHDLFASLIRSIVGQQISRKAAFTVYNRLSERIGIEPENIANSELLTIKECGMSMKKAEIIQEIAFATITGGIKINDYPNMTDEEIINDLTKLRGVGVWTAEMLLMFSLNRLNILSYNDLIIKKSICRLYGHEKLSKKDYQHYKELFSPYGSIASLYLWEFNKLESLVQI